MNNLNDKDYMTLLLSLVKAMEKNTCVFLTETSNEFLFSKIDKMFDKYKKLQREIFEAMYQNGYYNLEASETQKIKKAFDTLNKDYQELN